MTDEPFDVPPSDDEPVIELVIVTLAEFAATPEEGAVALLGDRDDILIPAGGDVMIYGDGGAGKTTLCLDLACHLAAGVGWLGIEVTNRLRVLLVENEGPRPLFRSKVRRKLEAWTAGPLDGHLRIIEAPWARLSLARRSHREALAKAAADHETDIVIIGPLAAAGMNEAGTLREVRSFMALCDDVRQLAGRNVTFLLIHHENKGGKVSGAWEGAGDTLLHLQGMGSGRTRLHVQKARWSTRWHAATLELRWTEGHSFAVEDKPEMSDDDIITQLLTVIGEQPGTGWTAVVKRTPGIGNDRRNMLRDRLLAERRVVNIVREKGIAVVLHECQQGRPAHLHRADDPAIRQLLLGSGEAEEKSSPPGVRAGSDNFSASPDLKEGEVGGEVVRGAPGPSDPTDDDRFDADPYERDHPDLFHANPPDEGAPP